MNITKINQTNFQAHIKLKPSDISKLAIGASAISAATLSTAEAGLSVAAMNQPIEKSLTPEVSESAVDFHKEIFISSNLEEEHLNREVSSETSLLPSSAGLSGGYASLGGSNAISAVINTDKLDKVDALTELYSSTPKAQLGTTLSSLLSIGALGLYSGNDILNNTEIQEYGAGLEQEQSDVSKLASYASIGGPASALIGSSSSDLSDAKSFEFIAKTLAGVDTEEENPS